MYQYYGYNYILRASFTKTLFSAPLHLCTTIYHGATFKHLPNGPGQVKVKFRQIFWNIKRNIATWIGLAKFPMASKMLYFNATEYFSISQIFFFFCNLASIIIIIIIFFFWGGQVFSEWVQSGWLARTCRQVLKCSTLHDLESDIHVW